MRLSPLSPETLSSPILLSFSLVYPMVWRRVEGAGGGERRGAGGGDGEK
jgi:hypothetical protein